MTNYLSDFMIAINIILVIGIFILLKTYNRKEVKMNKKAQVGEILESSAFWILLGVGYAAFSIMILVLRGMEQSSIMPLWVKIATLILIPIIAAVFSLYAES